MPTVLNDTPLGSYVDSHSGTQPDFNTNSSDSAILTESEITEFRVVTPITSATSKATTFAVPFDEQDVSSTHPADVTSAAEHITKSKQQCVKKSIAHLQLLQSSIEDNMWTTSVAYSSDKNSTGLVVEGQKIENDIPVIGPLDIIRENLSLLLFLNSDSRRITKLCSEQRIRAERLRSRVHQLERHRLQKLPEAVQKEHEDCATDIRELKWHVGYQKREHERTADRHKKSYKMLQQLKKDIEFISENNPLMKEKLELESNAMELISQAYRQTEKELEFTQGRLAIVTKHSETLRSKAERERAAIASELGGYRKQLSEATNALQQAEDLFKSYNERFDNAKSDIQKSERDSLMLEVKLDNTHAQLRNQKQTVEIMENRLTDLGFRHKELVDELQTTEEQLETTKETIKEAEKRKADLIDTIFKKHDNLYKKNKEDHIIVLDMNDHLEDVKKQRLGHEKVFARMETDLKLTAEQMEFIRTDWQKVKLVNDALRAELENESKKATKLEDDLKITLDSLKHQLANEKREKHTLRGLIVQDQKEKAKLAKEFKDRREKLDAAKAELMKAVEILERRVQKLQNAHSERVRVITRLETELNSQLEEHTRLEKELQTLRDKLIPERDYLLNVQADKNEQLDFMVWQTQMMNKKIEDMLSAGAVMEKTLAKVEAAIDVLLADLEEYQTQLNERKALTESLQNELNSLKKQIAEDDDFHMETYLERKSQFDKLLTVYHNTVKHNEDLASKYRQLQHDFTTYKDSLMSHYEGRVRLEASLKDKKQMFSLQQRMRQAQHHYHHLHGLWSDIRLFELTAASNENSGKVQDIKQLLDKELDNVTVFVENEVKAMTQDQKPQSDLPPIAEVPNTLSTTNQTEPVVSTTTNTGMLDIQLPSLSVQC